MIRLYPKNCLTSASQPIESVIQLFVKPLNFISQLNQRAWSPSILNFEGEQDLKPFESFREELGPGQRPFF